jgi:hypothetical protein
MPELALQAKQPWSYALGSQQVINFPKEPPALHALQYNGQFFISVAKSTIIL